MRLLVPKVSFFILALLVFPEAASACLCSAESPKKGFERAKKSSSVIVAGEVIEVVNGFSRGEFRGWRVTLKVTKYWKGEPGRELIVYTGPDDCAAHFEVGKQYLVFAFRDDVDQRLKTNVCMKTGLLSLSGDNLRRLGKGKDFGNQQPSVQITRSITRAWSGLAGK
jgi:hypothetical protein